MVGNKESWVKGYQEDIARGDEEAVPSKQRSKNKGRLKDKVNVDVPQMLILLPDIQRFLTVEATKEIQYETSPQLLGHVFGNIYSREQRRKMIYGIIQGEERYSEDPKATIQATADDLTSKVHRLEEGFETLQSANRVRRQIFSKLDDIVKDLAQSTGVVGNVSKVDVGEWIADQTPTESDFPALSKLLHAFLDEQNATDALTAYADELTVALTTVSTPEAKRNWRFNFQEPTAEDFQTHAQALDALESEFTRAVRQYWKNRRILARDRLLAAATQVVKNDLRQKHDRDLLEWMPCNKRRDGWTRYHTRRANRLVDRKLPVLTRQQKSNTVEYSFSAFGQFVKALWKYDGQSEYDDHLTAFTMTLDLSDSDIEAALDELEEKTENHCNTVTAS